MGHLTALGATPDDALARARTALGRLRWDDGGDGLPPPGAGR